MQLVATPREPAMAEIPLVCNCAQAHEKTCKNSSLNYKSALYQLSYAGELCR